MSVRSRLFNATACLAVPIVIACASAPVAPANAGLIYSNGFETDIAGWDVFGGGLNATRVASGTNGITSASGGFHAVSNAPNGGATNWGGYGFNPGCAATGCAAAAFPAGGYTTSVDVWLDVDAGLANNTRFDFSSAINTPAGGHRRDFIFNAGFYNDATGPGAGTDRFVISASNNSQPGSAFAKNPARDPIAIDNTGWYTFQHRFYDDGTGVLAVDLGIYDSSMTLIHTWTLSDPTDLIGSAVGGNRYGWFAYNELAVLAYDNAFLASAVPAPGTLATFGLGLAGLGLLRRRSRRRESSRSTRHPVFYRADEPA